MTGAELRNKTVEDLKAQLHELLRDAFFYRTQKATRNLTQTHLLKQGRRDIARIKTVLKEKVSENG